MNSSPASTLRNYRPPRLLRWLPVAALLVILIFSLITLAAVLFEGATWGLWTTFLLTALALYFAVFYWRMAYTVALDDDCLIVRRFGREKTVSYDEIRHAELGRGALALHTADGKVTLHGEPNRLVGLLSALEERVRTLARQRDARRTRSLPIAFRKERVSHLLPLVLLILVSLALLAALIAAWVAGRLTPDLSDVFLTFFFAFAAGLTLAIAGGIFLNYVDGVTFTREVVTVHTLRSDRRYDVDNLQDLRLQEAERTVRGIPRTFYTLELIFDDGKSLAIGPTFPDSLGRRQAHAHRQLADLRHALLRHYRPPLQLPGQGEVLPANEWGRAVLKRRYRFPAYELEVRQEDYGEHHNGAWSIHFTFSRPVVEDVTRFRTTNGDLAHSVTGRFLALVDATQLVLFDLERPAAHHFRLEQGWQFGRVTLADGALHWERVSLARSPRTVTLNPVPLTPEELKRLLAGGTGTHPPGDFPSAWPSLAPGRPPRTHKPSSPEQAVADLLAYACSPAGRRPEAFEQLRDDLNGLGAEAMPHVLEAARAAGDDDVLELLATVLVDNDYPPAYPEFVTWLDHPNDEVRFVCAWALDALADGAFGVSGMMKGGFVQHDRIRAAVPAIRGWWDLKGRQRVPSLAQWREDAAAQQPIGELEKWFNFLALNPTWVRFGNGTVAPQKKGFRLPQGQGVHLVAGRAWLHNVADPVFAAFVMDSDLGWIGGVYVRDGRRWVEVGQRMVRAEPNFGF